MTSNSVLIVGAKDVEQTLAHSEERVMDAVRAAYETHARGASSLPHSSFLRFPDSSKDRIICLPAYLGGDYELAGVKWIASMPDNVGKGMERASAVVILNDRETGRPAAIMEGSIISKHRTAASAALASKVLARTEPEVIGFVGCGPINEAAAQYLAFTWPDVKHYVAYDLDSKRAEAFGHTLRGLRPDAQFSVASDLNGLLAESSLVAFGTTAITPYCDNLDVCPADATLLHVSLRDLGVPAILSNHNIVDDLDHVNRAATSIHLASSQQGNTDFVRGSIGDVLLGNVSRPERDGRKVIFSPFGLGVLDLAVASIVQDSLKQSQGGTLIPSFLP